MNKNTQGMNMVNKPVTVLREEFIMNMSNLINNSGLPLFVIEPIVRDMLMEINAAVKRQYEMEKAQYEQALINSQNHDEDDISENEEECQNIGIDTDSV